MITNVETEPTGLRGLLKKYPAISYVIVGLLIATAAYFLLWGNAESKQQAYYTTDGGATFFAYNVIAPPFSYGGKEADGAVVVKDAAGKLNVAYVYRYPTDVLPAAQDAMKKGHPSPTDIEVKLPGASEWKRRKPTDMTKVRSQADFERLGKINADFDAIKAVKGAIVSPE